MKNYTITVNGTPYNVTVEEGTSSAPAPVAAAPAPAAAAAPAPQPKAAPAPQVPAAFLLMHRCRATSLMLKHQ